MPIKFVSVNGWSGAREAGRGAEQASGHVMPRVLEALTDQGLLADLTEHAGAWSSAVEHVRACEFCRAGVVSLARVGDTPAGSLQALLAHVEEGTTLPPARARKRAGSRSKPPGWTFDGAHAQVPNETTLASYVAVIKLKGSVSAAAQYPEVAHHLLGCPTCREDVTDMLGELALEHDAQARYAGLHATRRRALRKKWKEPERVIGA